MTVGYTAEKPLRVVELFAGIGAQAQALENLGIPYTSTVCEIDKRAYESYCAIHGDTPNLGDITKVEHLPECDLLTYSFPCQDLSVAGNQNGMQEGSGTRSSLLWEVGRLLEDARERERLPSYLLMENVDAILNKKNIGEFNRWIDKLSQMGYTSSYQVLNAKDFGVPQNRKRCFMVSVLEKGIKFDFPTGVPLEKCLKDVLEEDVNKSYYLSDKRIARYQRHKEKHEALGNGFGWSPSDGQGVAHCLNTVPTKDGQNFIVIASDLHIPGKHDSANRVYDTEGVSPVIQAACGQGGGITPKIEVRNNDFIPELDEGEICAMITPGRENKRQHGRRCKQDGTSYAITCQDQHGVAMNEEGKLRIRYLTPRECWRLMGFSDEAFDKAVATGMSNTQLYKQAGNSIVVNVLMAIFKGMFIDNTWEVSRNLDSWL